MRWRAWTLWTVLTLGPGAAAEARPVRAEAGCPARAEDPEARESAQAPEDCAKRSANQPAVRDDAPSIPKPTTRPAGMNPSPIAESIAREISAARFAEIFATPPPPRPVPTGWAYVGHGGVALLPVAAWIAASTAANQAVWESAINAASGALVGFVPSQLGYVYGNPNRARWREVDITLLTLSIVLTPPLAGLGTWGSQQLFFGGSGSPGWAYLGATGGALIGHLAGLAFVGLLDQHLNVPELAGFRFSLALAFVGTGAALGQALTSDAH